MVWFERLLTRERVLRVSVAILAVNVALYATTLARGRFPFDAHGTLVLPDFLAHLTGGALVADGRARDLYDVGEQSVFQAGITHDAGIVDVFLSPPLAACLYAPFAKLSYVWACALWTAVSLGLLALSARLLGRLTPSVAPGDRRVLFLAFAASQPVIHLLGSGQDTALSLAVWCAGTELALRRRDAAAGATFALGLFKPQLFLLPPLVFLALRRWRAAAAWALAASATAAITVGVFGTEGVRGWLQVLTSPEYLVSLRSGRALWMASVAPLVLAIAPDSLEKVADVLGKGLSVAIVAVAIARIVSPRARGDVDERSVWALACVTTLLATPHLFQYDLALLVLPVALLLEVSGAYSPAARGALVALAVLTWTAPVRVPLETAGWPLRVLAASWAAAPVFVLWREISRCTRAAALSA